MLMCICETNPDHSHHLPEFNRWLSLERHRPVSSKISSTPPPTAFWMIQNDYTVDSRTSAIAASFTEMIGYKRVKFSFALQDVRVITAYRISRKKMAVASVTSRLTFTYLFTEQGRLERNLYNMSSVNEQKTVSATNWRRDKRQKKR